MPNPPPYTACYSVHAACVAYKVGQYMLAPLTYNLAYEIWLCDQVLNSCLKGHIKPPGYIDLVASGFTDVVSDLQDALDSMRLWVQMNPEAAIVGTVLVIGTVAAIVYLGPGGLLIAALA